MANVRVPQAFLQVTDLVAKALGKVSTALLLRRLIPCRGRNWARDYRKLRHGTFLRLPLQRRILMRPIRNVPGCGGVSIIFGWAHFVKAKI